MEFSPESWQRAKDLFERAVELDPSHRSAFLADHCPDTALREQVEALLVNYAKAGSLLDNAIFDSPPTAESEKSTTSPDAINLAETANGVESDDPLIGRQLSAYKLMRRIGRGGMAAVYLAARADNEFRKLVAIKLVQPGLDSQHLLSRFRNERQTLAQLDHPNIVKLLDGGSTQEGLPFLVMDYVEGCPIDDYCDQHKLCIDDRLQVFTKVCEAVQYAHQHGVVHRDLKPANILVTADGTPKLLDFGIAKVLNPESANIPLLSTEYGLRCMTPAYASPEQMRGQPVTPATDVYSLGVVLYELLSGHRPYRLTQHTPAEIERAICEQDPETPSTAIDRVETDTSTTGVPTTKTPELVSQTREGQPERLRRRLRGDLDNIVLKSLQKEPERRYATAEDFSSDVQRHLQHMPVIARRNTAFYRIRKFAQRHKAEVSVMSGFLVMVLAALFLAFNLLGVRGRLFGSAHRSATFKTKGSTVAGGILPAVSCDSLANLKLPNTTITATQSFPAGRFTPSGSNPIENLPEFCRLEAITQPTADSQIRFEVWMPSLGWNRKFRAVGTSGFGGAINYDDMPDALRMGYATASTDAGHVSDNLDSTWALGKPEKVIDFGYRATHEMTAATKEILRAFYGQFPEWSYFQGCSDGGRDALMEAQRFPDDYQGILGGAPAVYSIRLMTSGLYNVPTSSPTYIPASKIPAISAAVRAACDAQDGVADGLINDPPQCRFDPSVLLCRGAESEACLTASQVTQLKKMYGGLKDSKGRQLYPGYPPGSEEGDDGWTQWLTGSGPGQGMISIFAINFFRNMVFDNPTWDFRSISAEKAAAIADIKVGGIVDPADPDLRRFQAHGGKLILYHGWSDAGMSPFATIKYYDSVAAAMSADQPQNFVRLYLAPGMRHCYGGPGPNSFGQIDLTSLGAKSSPTNLDPQYNISIALEQWVEKGVAPGPVIATKYIDDSDPAQGIKMTRPLCPYPQVSTYKGSGDTNSASNFVCAEATSR
jgi:serine/threonine protein kinase